MLYFVTALYAEAKPLIQHYQLKKVDISLKLQLFINEEKQVCLIISGVGPSASSIATTYLLTKYPSHSNDKVINIGVCGAVDEQLPLGTILIAHKIIEQHTRHTFYPDLLLQHSFLEGAVETYSSPVVRAKPQEIEGDVVDMESSAFYQAASTFVAPHQIYCLKIVSDHLMIEQVNSKQVTSLIQNSLDQLVHFFHKLEVKQQTEEELLSTSDEALLATISEQLKLSVTMKHELDRLATQYKITQQHSLAPLEPYQSVEVKTKQEGKRYFEQIKEKLLYS